MYIIFCFKSLSVYCSKMSEHKVQMIKAQTNIEDENLIRATLIKFYDDEIATIMALMNIKDMKRAEKPRTYIDELREILGEKEELFKKVMEAQAYQQQAQSIQQQMNNFTI